MNVTVNVQYYCNTVLIVIILDVQHGMTPSSLGLQYIYIYIYVVCVCVFKMKASGIIFTSE